MYIKIVSIKVSHNTKNRTVLSIVSGAEENAKEVIASGTIAGIEAYCHKPYFFVVFLGY